MTKLLKVIPTFALLFTLASCNNDEPVEKKEKTQEELDAAAAERTAKDRERRAAEKEAEAEEEAKLEAFGEAGPGWDSPKYIADYLDSPSSFYLGESLKIDDIYLSIENVYFENRNDTPEDYDIVLEVVYRNESPNDMSIDRIITSESSNPDVQFAITSLSDGGVGYRADDNLSLLGHTEEVLEIVTTSTASEPFTAPGDASSLDTSTIPTIEISVVAPSYGEDSRAKLGLHHDPTDVLIKK